MRINVQQLFAGNSDWDAEIVAAEGLDATVGKPSADGPRLSLASPSTTTISGLSEADADRLLDTLFGSDS